jgi:hypothetical protein
MKKIFLSAAVILYATSISFASEVNLAGISVSLKGGSFIPNNKNKNNAVEVLNGIFNGSEEVYSDASEASVYNLGIDMSYEREFSNKQYAGFQIGYMVIFDSTHYDVSRYSSGGSFRHFSDYEVFYSAYSIPIDIYYKYKLTKKFNVSVSAGINVVYSDLCLRHMERSETGVNDYYTYVYEKEERSQTVIIPTITAGAEFLLSKYVGIFTEFGYWFNGKSDLKLRNNTYLYRKFEGAFFNVGINIYPFAFKKKNAI